MRFCMLFISGIRSTEALCATSVSINDVWMEAWITFMFAAGERSPRLTPAADVTANGPVAWQLPTVITTQATPPIAFGLISGNRRERK